VLTTKIRTTIIALVAASGFAAASMVPAVSQARIKKPSGMSHNVYCSTLHSAYGTDIGTVRDPGEDKETKENALAEAVEIVGAARAAGCSWASRVLPLESPTALAETPVGATQGAEAALPPVRSIAVTPARATAP
jgi:hypothetical protein